MAYTEEMAKMVDSLAKPIGQAKVFIVDSNPEDSEADAWGPYTLAIAQAVLSFCKQAGYLAAEVVERGLDEYGAQIGAGLKPYHIRVAVIDGKPQLPADVEITWPPAKDEGIQDSSEEETHYFIWAQNDKDALLRLARLNRAAPRARAEA